MRKNLADGEVGDFLTRLNQWALERLTTLNRGILAGAVPRHSFATDLQFLLDQAPAAEDLSPEQAQRCVVALGFAGASLGRHFQEADRANRQIPQGAFAGLVVKSTSQPFLTYFRSMARRTGTGHGDRDTYASLVRWNLPRCEVRWDGDCVASLDGVFGDSSIRTYTAAPDEYRFFGLLKATETIEHAVNQFLLPVSAGDIPLRAPEAAERFRSAARLLDALRTVNSAFASRPVDEGLGVGYFMTVFRQFAVHWRIGDIPPSGALDAESLVRDLLLGLSVPGYEHHLRSVFPGLLEDERRLLTALMERPSLPDRALDAAGVSREELLGLSPSAVAGLLQAHPVLGDLYELLNAQARAAGVHLRMTKKFLFHPQRTRDAAGLGDPGVVSNRRGTTGMDELNLETLTRARHRHALTPLHAAESTARRRHEPTPARIAVRFVGSDLPDLGLPAPDPLTASVAASVTDPAGVRLG